jgi:hypothetical protein
MEREGGRVRWARERERKRERERERENTLVSEMQRGRKREIRTVGHISNCIRSGFDFDSSADNMRTRSKELYSSIIRPTDLLY